MLWEDNEFRLAVGRNIIGAKLKNTASVMMRAARESRESSPDALDDGIAIVNAQRQLVREASSIDELRGYEGVAAAAYFQRFGNVLRSVLGSPSRTGTKDHRRMPSTRLCRSAICS